MAHITRTQQAISLWKKGNKRKALKIFKTFRLGITKSERDTITTAYEILTEGGDFYAALGIDTEKCITDAGQIINRLFLK